MAGRGQERSLNRIATGEESELNMFLRGPKVWHLVGPLDRPSIHFLRIGDVRTGYPESVNTRPDSVEVLQVEASQEAQNAPSLPMEIVVLQLQYGSVQDRRTQREGRTSLPLCAFPLTTRRWDKLEAIREWG